MTFLLDYPEFSQVEESVINHFLKRSELLVNKKAWGKLYEQGLFAYTAHTLALKGYLNAKDEKGEHIFNNGESFKTVASKTAGGLSISYSSQGSTASTSDGDLCSTTYGQEYLRLKKLVMPFGVVV